MASAVDTDVRLSTIPRRVFVDNDGIVEPWPTESFVFFLVVEDGANAAVAPIEARVELLSKGEVVQVMEFSRPALQAVRAVRFKTPRVALSEAFDLRHHVSVPVVLNVDRVRYRLTLTRDGAAFAAELETTVRVSTAPCRICREAPCGSRRGSAFAAATRSAASEVPAARNCPTCIIS